MREPCAIAFKQCQILQQQQIYISAAIELFDKRCASKIFNPSLLENKHSQHPADMLSDASGEVGTKWKCMFGFSSSSAFTLDTSAIHFCSTLLHRQLFNYE